MTRISSFSLYACPECRQIHIKPEYGSVSIYVPTDLFIEPTAIKKCQGCSWEGKFGEFKYMGSTTKINTKIPSKLVIYFRKFIKKPYVENDVRKIYPSL